MPTYNRPGVYVNESSMKAIVTNRPGRTTASFVGQATRGPLGKPVLSSNRGGPLPPPLVTSVRHTNWGIPYTSSFPTEALSATSFVC